MYTLYHHNFQPRVLPNLDDPWLSFVWYGWIAHHLGIAYADEGFEFHPIIIEYFESKQPGIGVIVPTEIVCIDDEWTNFEQEFDDHVEHVLQSLSVSDFLEFSLENGMDLQTKFHLMMDDT